MKNNSGSSDKAMPGHILLYTFPEGTLIFPPANTDFGGDFPKPFPLFYDNLFLGKGIFSYNNEVQISSYDTYSLMASKSISPVTTKMCGSFLMVTSLSIQPNANNNKGGKQQALITQGDNIPPPVFVGGGTPRHIYTNVYAHLRDGLSQKTLLSV